MWLMIAKKMLINFLQARSLEKLIQWLQFTTKRLVVTLSEKPIKDTTAPKKGELPEASRNNVYYLLGIPLVHKLIHTFNLYLYLKILV